ncbi:PREDICTED: uncharacterized protein LOC109153870 [Ipomoea nil]|uniref:uncharacterized protein LOC109153870 n=1 Tax=Ipomoea nil TaxID=35883 RepID=UPI0009013C96|nr:PREDICTED: uncharacterized protein LOC109153870 [Ipomoea nil]
MHLAVGRNTSREVWLSLTSALASTTHARCLSLLGQFQTLRQGNSTTAEYLGKAQLIVEALSLASWPLSLDEQILYVLRGLQPEFRSMASLSQAQKFIHSDDFPTMDNPGAIGNPTAFFAGPGKQHGGDPHFGRRHSSNGNQGRSRGRGRGDQGRGRGGTPRCQICRSHGHTAVYCYKQYADRPSPNANMAVSGDAVADVLADAWFSDTGASAHTTPDEHMMTDSDAYTGGDVLKVGNGACLDVSRVGHAIIPSESKFLNMSNVLHVPKLSLPLLLVHRFTNENNVYFEFHKNLFVVKDSITKAFHLKGSTTGGLYKLLVPRSHFSFLTARASPTV